MAKKRIKDLANTAGMGDIVTGNYFAIDGSAGTKKLDSLTLLVKTANNALEKNMAPAFSSSSNYSFGEKVIYNGSLRRAKENITAGAYDNTKWEVVSEITKDIFVISSVNIAYLNDLDSYPQGSSVTCTNNALVSSISHLPISETFVVYTFTSIASSISFQIFVSSSQKIYIRRKWSTWSSWMELGDSAQTAFATSIAPAFSTSNSYSAGNVVEKDGVLIRAKVDITAGAYDATKWETKNVFDAASIPITATNVSYFSDLDNYPVNTICSVTNNTIASSIAHKPVESQFVVYTIAQVGIPAAAFQFFMSQSDKKLYFRGRWSTWGDWIEITGVQSEPQTINPIACFDNFVCIGDSLTWCQVYTGSGLSDQRQAKKLWGDILAYNCNGAAQTIASPGDTAITCWPRVDANLVSKTNSLAIVYLGTNGGLTDTLDEDAPAADPYSDWANTNTGCYAKIVAKAQSLGYKVLLVKPWAGGGGDLPTTQDVIDQIGARFGCCVIGPFHTSEIKYHYYPDLSGSNSLHYNDLGYAWFATALPYYVSKADNNQLKYIIPS